MFKRISLVAALAAAFAVGVVPAAAQNTAPAKASPAEIASAKAYAAGLIEAAGAGDLFVNRTDSGVAAVTHLRSGLSCLIPEGPDNQVHIFATSIARGDDVACIMNEGEVSLTSYATRYPDGMNTRSIVTNAVSGIRQRWPDAVAYKGELFSATMGDAPVPETAAFEVEVGGKRMFTMVLGVQSGEWSFKVRITGPMEDAEALSMQGAVTMAYIQMKQAQAQAATGAQ